jgi:hypothetical protein
MIAPFPSAFLALISKWKSEIIKLRLSHLFFRNSGNEFRFQALHSLFVHCINLQFAITVFLRTELKLSRLGPDLFTFRDAGDARLADFAMTNWNIRCVNNR